jgi:hypothetical protein
MYHVATESRFGRPHRPRNRSSAAAFQLEIIHGVLAHERENLLTQFLLLGIDRLGTFANSTQLIVQCNP